MTLAATKGDKTVAELAYKYNLHANQISTWKEELLENTAMIFASEKTLVGPLLICNSTDQSTGCHRARSFQLHQLLASFILLSRCLNESVKL